MNIYNSCTSKHSLGRTIGVYYWKHHPSTTPLPTLTPLFSVEGSKAKGAFPTARPGWATVSAWDCTPCQWISLRFRQQYFGILNIERQLTLMSTLQHGLGKFFTMLCASGLGHGIWDYLKQLKNNCFIGRIGLTEMSCIDMTFIIMCDM